MSIIDIYMCVSICARVHLYVYVSTSVLFIRLFNAVRDTLTPVVTIPTIHTILYVTSSTCREITACVVHVFTDISD